MEKRKIQIAVISDLHLGTFGCQAKSIVDYLRSIEPKILILNGDIVDIWQFSKHYFPASHMEVIREIFAMLSKGITVYYITGNHDEKLRRFSDLALGHFILTDKLVLEIEGKKTWIFHGDVFDATTKGWAKYLAKMGGIGYDILILLNQIINKSLEFFGKEKMSFSKKMKHAVKKAVTYIENFEETAIELAIQNQYDQVICGHIHQPQIKTIFKNGKSVTYLNSGDWVENCSSLEYYQHQWHLYHHPMVTKNPEIHKNKNLAPNVIVDPIQLFISNAS
ncbi:MAG: UDP-2,3-diacylglucosamine diphosphatase [Bacteroidetes bacterium]|nr:UDP-2,3-diacylglucosamine diphosphatase [Bacteroidota bacterium]